MKRKKRPTKWTAPLRNDFFEDDEYSSEEYEQMMQMYEETLSNIEEGEIVKARVLRVTDKESGPATAGEEVEVFLENLEDAEGVVVLSKKKADFLRVWEKIKQAYESNEKVPGMLTRKIEGGVTVDLDGRRRVPAGIADRAASRAEY